MLTRSPGFPIAVTTTWHHMIFQQKKKKRSDISGCVGRQKMSWRWDCWPTLGYPPAPGGRRDSSRKLWDDLKLSAFRCLLVARSLMVAVPWPPLSVLSSPGSWEQKEVSSQAHSNSQTPRLFSHKWLSKFISLSSNTFVSSYVTCRKPLSLVTMFGETPPLLQLVCLAELLAQVCSLIFQSKTANLTASVSSA